MRSVCFWKLTNTRDHHLTLKCQNTTYQGSSIRRISTWVDIINQDTNDLQPYMPARLFPHLGKSNYHLYVKITCQTTLGDHYGRKKGDILFFVFFFLSANNKIKHNSRYLVKYKHTRPSFSAESLQAISVLSIPATTEPVYTPAYFYIVMQKIHILFLFWDNWTDNRKILLPEPWSQGMK